MRHLIEECPYFSVSSIRQDLGRSRRMEPDIKGIFNISQGNRKLLCEYWIDYSNNETFLFISTGTSNLPQRILLSKQELYFGSRSYFVCECGKRVIKLYIPSGRANFACRSCCGLQYELSTINRSSTHGAFLYKTNRTLKLINQRADMNRIIYKGSYTRRYNRFLKLCQQSGLYGVVKDAQDLMLAIN